MAAVESTPARAALTAWRPSVSVLTAAAGLSLVAILLLRSAWLCDDAYITLRSVDNFVNGYGLRWNVAERVQSFTHPAWLMLITPVYAVTREAYFTVLGLQIGLALATVWLLLRHVARTPVEAALGLGAIVGSKALIDFSTSGLENPLAHLLLVLFFLTWRRDRQSPSLFVLGLLTSVILLCRLDLGLLVAPLIAAAIRPMRFTRVGSFALGLVPFVAWEAFSLVYYGQLVPNTALAKLPPGVATADLAAQGGRYLLATFHFDPITPILLVASALVLGFACRRAGRVVLAGMIVHVLYVVGVGGDFMSGRFLTPALVMGLAGVLGLVTWQRAVALRLAVPAAMVAGSLLGPAAPLRTWADFGAVAASAGEFDRYGVTDERRFYYPSFGLLPVLAGHAVPDDHPWAAFGRTRRALADRTGQDVVLASNVGVFGYYAGPKVYIIDRNALADAFLARLPPAPGWRVAHYERDVPDGYLESRRQNQNLLADPSLRSLYDRVQMLSQADLWSRARFRVVLASMWPGGARGR